MLQAAGSRRGNLLQGDPAIYISGITCIDGQTALYGVAAAFFSLPLSGGSGGNSGF
jgi:hypothetical protein